MFRRGTFEGPFLDPGEQRERERERTRVLEREDSRTFRERPKENKHRKLSEQV